MRESVLWGWGRVPGPGREQRSEDLEADGPQGAREASLGHGAPLVIATEPLSASSPGPGSRPVDDGAPVAIISHAFWVRHFGGSPNAVGTALRVNGRPYTVIGVTEPGFQGSSIIGTDMWVPFSMAPDISGRVSAEMLTGHGTVWHLGIARLKDEVSLEQARDELNGLLAPLKEAHPEAYGRWSIALLPSARLPGEFRTPVMAFVGVLFALTFMGPRMQEMLARLEEGADPDELESEMGDAGEEEEGGEGDFSDFFRPKQRAGAGRARRPKIDETLYFL